SRCGDRTPRQRPVPPGRPARRPEREGGERRSRLPLLGVVPLLHRRALALVLSGEAVHVGLELEIAHPRIAQPFPDAFVGHGALFPVRDVVLLRDVADAAAEGVELAARLDVGRRVLPHVALVLGLRALRRARPRAASRGVRRRLRAVGGSFRAGGEGAALWKHEHTREEQHSDEPENSEMAIMAHGLDLVVVNGWRAKWLRRFYAEGERRTTGKRSTAGGKETRRGRINGARDGR